MKQAFTLIAFLAFSFTLLAQAPFEGIIQVSSENPAIGENANLSWFVKDGQHRMQFNGNGEEGNYAYDLYFSSTSSTITMVSDYNGQKVRYESPMGSATSNLEKAYNVEAVETGKTKTIAGKSCKQYKLEDSKTKTTVWVTNDLNLGFEGMPAVFKGQGVLQSLSAAGVNGFPLEIVMTDLSGDLVMSQSITSIQPQTIESNMVTVPTDTKLLNEVMQVEQR